MLKTLETKLKDENWIKSQDEEFVNLLIEISKSVYNLATRTYIMADLIDKFYEAVAALFEEEQDTATSVQQNGNVYPEPNTNFSEAAQ